MLDNLFSIRLLLSLQSLVAVLFRLKFRGMLLLDITLEVMVDCVSQSLSDSHSARIPQAGAPCNAEHDVVIAALALFKLTEIYIVYLSLLTIIKNGCPHNANTHLYFELSLILITRASCPSDGDPCGRHARYGHPHGACARAQPSPRASAKVRGARAYTCWSSDQRR